MQILKERIILDGQHLGRGILKVDAFLNQQVDIQLMQAIGQELARRLAPLGPNKVLTVETGGILPAFTTASALNVPLVFARKHRPVGMHAQPLQESTLSRETERIVSLMVSPEFLGKNDRVVIIDDFLTSAQTILALARLARSSGAQVVGIGAVIEKAFDHGREALKTLRAPVESLVTIERFENGNIIFKD
ncbi:MAG: xanthine phosphoribosyltransferase [Anaerolineae bacterium]